MNAGAQTIPNVVVITGATGFIGQHLIKVLTKFERMRIRILSRADSTFSHQFANVTTVIGDLGDKASLDQLVTPGCTVINLAYSYGSSREQNLAYATNLANVCSKIKPVRVLHCSTASVFGSITSNSIDESMPCRPVDEYGRTKLEIEEIFREAASSHFRLFTLRPTAVLGLGGLTLTKLIDEIRFESRFKNYLRESVYGSRRLNLVGVSTLVDALIFLMASDTAECGEYIISQDEVQENNYEYFSDLVYDKIGVSRMVPRLYFPSQFLEVLLKIRGRPVSQVNRNYSNSKLREAGFTFKENFCTNLSAHISDYISFRSGDDKHKQTSEIN